MNEKDKLEIMDELGNLYCLQTDYLSRFITRTRQNLNYQDFSDYVITINARAAGIDYEIKIEKNKIPKTKI